MRNQEIIRKADMALSDLATAGLLNPEQTDQFLRTLIESPTILQNCRTVAMAAPQMKVNKLGFGSRILRPAVSATALSSSDRVKPDLGQIQLNTKEVIAEIHLPYDVIEDNIERGNINVPLQGNPGGLHQTIVDLIAERAALDLEELGLKGDTTSGDSYLALSDGWLKMANVNVVDAANSTYSKDVVKSVLKATPPKYLRNRAAMMHFVSINNETEMRDTYANRIGALGDANVQGNLPLYSFGSKVVGVPLMPGANALFTDPLNLLFGIQRNITIEYTKDITARVFIIVLTARIAFQIELADAITKVINING